MGSKYYNILIINMIDLNNNTQDNINNSNEILNKEEDVFNELMITIKEKSKSEQK